LKVWVVFHSAQDQKATLSGLRLAVLVAQIPVGFHAQRSAILMPEPA